MKLLLEGDRLIPCLHVARQHICNMSITVQASALVARAATSSEGSPFCSPSISHINTRILQVARIGHGSRCKDHIVSPSPTQRNKRVFTRRVRTGRRVQQRTDEPRRVRNTNVFRALRYFCCASQMPHCPPAGRRTTSMFRCSTRHPSFQQRSEIFPRAPTEDRIMALDPKIKLSIIRSLPNGGFLQKRGY